MTFLQLQMNINFKFDHIVQSILLRHSLHVLSESDPISMSQLIGNALEILNLKGDQNVEDMKMLGQLVLQLSNPSCY
jgi:hypothetical protein